MQGFVIFYQYGCSTVAEMALMGKMRRMILLAVSCKYSMVAAARTNVLYIISDDLRPELPVYGVPEVTQHSCRHTC